MAAANEADTFVNPGIDNTPLELILPEAVMLANCTLLPVMANDAVEEFDTLAAILVWLVVIFVWSAELDAFN